MTFGSSMIARQTCVAAVGCSALLDGLRRLCFDLKVRPPQLRQHSFKNSYALIVVELDVG